MSMFHRGAVIFSAVVRWCSEISSATIFVMMVLITGDVIGRYFLNSPIPGTVEISESLIVFIVFLAYAYTEATEKNIKMEILERFLTRRQLQFLNILACLIGVFVYGLICWQGVAQTLAAIEIGERVSGELRFPTWIPRLGLAWGAFILTLQFLIGAIKNLGMVFNIRGLKWILNY